MARLLAALWLIWGGDPSAIRAETDPQRAARQLLEESGLHRQGEQWLLAEEERLIRAANLLDPLSRQVRLRQQRVAALVAQNEARGQQLQRARQTLARLAAIAGDTRRPGEQRRRAEAQAEVVRRQIRELESAYKAPERFPEDIEVRRELIAWINARNELGLICLMLPDQIREVESQYRRLAARGDVAEALAAFGGRHRLGSGRSYDRLPARLDDYRSAAWEGDVPLYRLEGLDRVSAIVNERTAGTFTWRQESGTHVVQSSLPARAGITIPEDAPLETVRLGGNVWQGPRVRIDSLRLGRFVIHDLEAIVLPPEAEHLGSTLFADSLPTSLAGRADRARARLDLQP